MIRRHSRAWPLFNLFALALVAGNLLGAQLQLRDLQHQAGHQQKLLNADTNSIISLWGAVLNPPHGTHVTSAATSPPLVYICQQQPCANAQEFEVFDGNGAPIFSVGEFGDVGTFGTGFAVFAPGSVTNPVVTLNTNGTVTVGGQTLTPADVAFLHQLEASWLSVPRLTRPVKP